MESMIDSSLIFAAIKELKSTKIKPTFDNISCILSFHQQNEDEEFKQHIKEVLHYGVYFGVLRKKGLEYVVVEQEMNGNGAEEGATAANSPDETDHQETVKEETATVQNKIDSHYENAENNAMNMANDERSAESKANVCEHGGELENLNAFGRDVVQVLLKYAKRHRERAKRARGSPATRTLRPRAVIPPAIRPPAVHPRVVLPRVVLPSAVLPRVVLPRVVLSPAVRPPAVSPRVVLPRVVLPRAVLPRVVLPRVVLPHAVLPRVVLPRVVLPRAVRPRNQRILASLSRQHSGSHR